MNKKQYCRIDTRWPVMRIEKVDCTTDRTVIETTGAIYTVWHANPGRIEAVQKINGPRRVFEMEFQTSFENMSLDFHDEDECALYCPLADFGFNVRVFADSLLWVRAGSDVRVRVRGDWLPEYSYAEGGNMLLLDKFGGCGQYVLPSAHPYGSRLYFAEPGLSFDRNGWETRYTLPSTRRVLACVAPPRPFNLKQLCSDRIVHHFIAGKDENGAWLPYPSDARIREYSEVGNILALHWWARGAGPAKGLQVASRVDLYSKAAPWATRRHLPLEEGDFRRVIATAHECGMRVVPYASPLFFPGTGGEFLAELSRLLETYAIDGIYFDGVSENIIEAYEILKGTRRLLGPDRLLYVHIPSPILGSSYGEGKYVYCPFIDTYADFILRAEHIENFEDAMLRYTISGYNISNTIGLACNYDYSLEFNRKLLAKVLDYRAGVQYWGGWDIYLKDCGKDLGVEYPPEAETQKLMREIYYPALDRLAAGEE